MGSIKHFTIPIITEEICVIVDDGFINIYIGTSNKEDLKLIENKIIKECEKYHKPEFNILYDFKVKTQFSEKLWDEEHFGNIKLMTYTNKSINENINLVSGKVTGFEKVYWARIKQQ